MTSVRQRLWAVGPCTGLWTVPAVLVELLPSGAAVRQLDATSDAVWVVCTDGSVHRVTSTPRPVTHKLRPPAGVSNFVVDHIACGTAHVLLLARSGPAAPAVYAFGDNTDGQCGLSTSVVTLNAPTPVPALNRQLGGSVKRLAGGAAFSAAVLNSGGAAFWGGVGGTAGATPVVIVVPPAVLAGGSRTLFPGGRSALFTADGTSALHDDDDDDSDTAARGRAVDVAVGDAHFLCATSALGGVFEWSAPPKRQRDAATSDFTVPVTAAAPSSRGGSGGGAHTGAPPPPSAGIEIRHVAAAGGPLWAVRPVQVAASGLTNYVLADDGRVFSWGLIHAEWRSPTEGGAGAAAGAREWGRVVGDRELHATFTHLASTGVCNYTWRPYYVEDERRALAETPPALTYAPTPRQIAPDERWTRLSVPKTGTRVGLPGGQGGADVVPLYTYPSPLSDRDLHAFAHGPHLHPLRPGIGRAWYGEADHVDPRAGGADGGGGGGGPAPAVVDEGDREAEDMMASRSMAPPVSRVAPLGPAVRDRVLALLQGYRPPWAAAPALGVTEHHRLSGVDGRARLHRVASGGAGADATAATAAQEPAPVPPAQLLHTFLQGFVVGRVAQCRDLVVFTGFADPVGSDGGSAVRAAIAASGRAPPESVYIAQPFFVRTVDDVGAFRVGWEVLSTVREYERRPPHSGPGYGLQGIVSLHTLPPVWAVYPPSEAVLAAASAARAAAAAAAAERHLRRALSAPAPAASCGTTDPAPEGPAAACLVAALQQQPALDVSAPSLDALLAVGSGGGTTGAADAALPPGSAWLDAALPQLEAGGLPPLAPPPGGVSSAALADAVAVLVDCVVLASSNAARAVCTVSAPPPQPPVAGDAVPTSGVVAPHGAASSDSASSDGDTRAGGAAALPPDADNEDEAVPPPRDNPALLALLSSVGAPGRRRKIRRRRDGSTPATPVAGGAGGADAAGESAYLRAPPPLAVSVALDSPPDAEESAHTQGVPGGLPRSAVYAPRDTEHTVPSHTTLRVPLLWYECDPEHAPLCTAVYGSRAWRDELAAALSRFAQRRLAVRLERFRAHGELNKSKRSRAREGALADAHEVALALAAQRWRRMAALLGYTAGDFTLELAAASESGGEQSLATPPPLAFRVHRSILAARVPDYYGSMLTSGMREATAGAAPLPLELGGSRAAAVSLLRYVYTGSPGLPSRAASGRSDVSALSAAADVAVALLAAADTCLLPDLRATCEQWLVHHVATAPLGRGGSGAGPALVQLLEAAAHVGAARLQRHLSVVTQEAGLQPYPLPSPPPVRPPPGALLPAVAATAAPPPRPPVVAAPASSVAPRAPPPSVWARRSAVRPVVPPPPRGGDDDEGGDPAHAAAGDADGDGAEDVANHDDGEAAYDEGDGYDEDDAGDYPGEDGDEGADGAAS